MKTQKNNILQLNEEDNIGVVIQTIQVGDIISINGTEIVVKSLLEVGHKLALKNMSKGDQVIKYGIAIGRTNEDIEAGMHVHTHNMKSDYIPTYLGIEKI